MYNKDEMTELHSAQECKSNADSAEFEIEMKAIAYAINSASNTGLYSAEYLSSISSEAMDELVSKGYDVKFIGGQGGPFKTVISWKE